MRSQSAIYNCGMPKDFAGRGRKTTRKRPATKRKTNQRPLFHGPSFSFGAIVGAGLVIFAAYAPEWLLQSDKPDSQQVAEIEQTPKLEYRFPELLEEAEVQSNPDIYAPPAQDPDVVPRSYHIQAASFRDVADANELRANLILKNLPAAVDATQVNDRPWFRVVVGPFGRKVEADRAMTEMRKMLLTPIWLNKHN